MCSSVPRRLLLWVATVAPTALFSLSCVREWTHTTSSAGSASLTKGGSVRHPEFCPPAPDPSLAPEVVVVEGGGWTQAFTWGSTRLAARRWAAAGTEPAQWGGCGWWGTQRLLRKKERQSPGVREHRRQRGRKWGGGGQGHRQTAHVKNAWASQKEKFTPSCLLFWLHPINE